MQQYFQFYAFNKMFHIHSELSGQALTMTAQLSRLKGEPEHLSLKPVSASDSNG
jgi:hypothetical protein